MNSDFIKMLEYRRALISCEENRVAVVHFHYNPSERPHVVAFENYQSARARH